MKKVYLDNAATTQIRSEVIQEMTTVMVEDYGNPSSTHQFGRSAKNLLELSRKSIAKQLNATAQEIVFTSSGTEANNWILRNAILNLNVKRFITSKIEHHAVLHALEALEKEFAIAIDYVNVRYNGQIDISHLVTLLSDDAPTLVSLMHVNNEIGTILDIDKISRICKQHNAYFHSDTVQSVGKIVIDLQQTPVDFIVSSAHKFHGPKGIGFAYIKKGFLMRPMFFGGEQEKGWRAGTESLHNVVGMAKALEISYTNLDKEISFIAELKNYCITQLSIFFPDFITVGENCCVGILNVILPIPQEKAAMLLFHLDMKGIAVSRGSACQSGSSKPSHVLAEILDLENSNKPNLRISFSSFNTKSDIDYLMTSLVAIAL